MNYSPDGPNCTAATPAKALLNRVYSAYLEEPFSHPGGFTGTSAPTSLNIEE